MNGTNSSAKHYDMVVIGSGAAGHHGAIQAAKLGKKIAVVERSIAARQPTLKPQPRRVVLGRFCWWLDILFTDRRHERKIGK
jgi:flavin-dependent dehydrogenase